MGFGETAGACARLLGNASRVTTSGTGTQPHSLTTR